MDVHSSTVGNGSGRQCEEERDAVKPGVAEDSMPAAQCEAQGCTDLQRRGPQGTMQPAWSMYFDEVLESTLQGYGFPFYVAAT